MFSSLNASNFAFSGDFCNAEFKDILSKIVKCYQFMIEDNVQVPNNENLIRDSLLMNYLKKNEVREKVGLLNYLFDREVPEDKTIGRTDIKIQTVNTFVDTDAYYIIECKRLDATNTKGNTGLNAKYIENGILRFVSTTYSSYYKVNGMIGFVVQELDIEDNVSLINNLFNEFPVISCQMGICKIGLTENFEYCYHSSHSTNDGDIIIYHLMLDFSKNLILDVVN